MTPPMVIPQAFTTGASLPALLDSLRGAAGLPKPPAIPTPPQAPKHVTFMASDKKFSGPWAKNLKEFHAQLASMPSECRKIVTETSADVITTICNKSYLHVWESDSDLDSLIQLTQVIVKIRNLSAYIPQRDGVPKSVPAGMLILTEVHPDRDNFARVCELVKYLLGHEGRPHLNGGVMSFDGIKVVRGVDNTLDITSNEGESVARRAVERINKAIDRTFDSGFYGSADVQKVVWHHGPCVSLLNFWINNTTHDLRSSLAAITIHSAFVLSDRGFTLTCPSSSSSKAHAASLQTLTTYISKLDIPAVFTDTSSQLITYTPLQTYSYYHAYYLHTLLPPSLLVPHFHAALDALVLYCFRLHAACSKRYNGDAVATVQEHLRHAVAKTWARACIDADSYEKKTCQSMARDEEIYGALTLADAPFKMFAAGAPGGGARGGELRAFSRLTLGPASEMISEHYVGVPVDFESPSSSSSSSGKGRMQIRAHYPSHTHYYIPNPLSSSYSSSSSSSPTSQLETVTNRLRGVLMGVLDLVRTTHPELPFLSNEERECWNEAARACEWALAECKGKLPRGVEEKVEFVRGGLATGTWAWVLEMDRGGRAKGGMVSSAGQGGEWGGWMDG